jgi:hypothetical protein
LERVDARVERIDERLERVDTRVERIERKLDQVIDAHSPPKVVNRRRSGPSKRRR